MSSFDKLRRKTDEYSRISGIRRIFYMLRHGLMARFMLVCCMIVIPVNVLSLICVKSINDSYKKNAYETIRGRLETYVKGINDDNQNIQDSFSNLIITEYYRELTNGGATESILTDIHLKNAMEKMRFEQDFIVSYFFYDREKDFSSFYSVGNSSGLTGEAKTALEQKMTDSRRRSGSYELISTEEGDYIGVIYNYPWFSFGYCISCSLLAQSAFTYVDQPVGAVQILNEDGTLLARCPEKEGDLQIPDASGDRIVPTAESGLPLRVVYEIYQNERNKLLPPSVYAFYFYAVLSIAVLPLLYLLVKKMIFVPLSKLVEGMNAVTRGDLSNRVSEECGSYQMDFIMMCFNAMMDEIQYTRIASYEAEIEKLQTETINAHLQVNQHMLLNSLNIIYSLVQMGRKEETSEFTVLLMKYFQYTLRKGTPVTTVREEIAFISDYVRLQKIRIKDKFSAVFAVAEDAKEAPIPQLLIQGFVENAIKYALRPAEPIEIVISVRREEQRILISVVDTGIGISEETLKCIRQGEPVQDVSGRHIGLSNTRKRLDYYYDSDYQLKITSRKNEGTQIFLDIPDTIRRQDPMQNMSVQNEKEQEMRKERK